MLKRVLGALTAASSALPILFFLRGDGLFSLLGVFLSFCLLGEGISAAVEQKRGWGAACALTCLLMVVFTHVPIKYVALSCALSALLLSLPGADGSPPPRRGEGS